MAKRTSGKTRRRTATPRKGIKPVEKPKFVWCEPTGLGRNVFVIFRRSFSLPGDAVKKLAGAQINLFADTRYRLWVNGQIVAYGPGRFAPGRPEYDRIDLRPWLAKGPNSIVVEACSYGAKNFEAMPSIGGFIVWGEIRAGKTQIDLSTPGDWRMQLSDAWDADAPTYSFAQTAAEICDTRKLPGGIRDRGFDDSGWARPVLLANQAAWGAPIPRSVPMLTMDLHLPEKVRVHSALANDEEVIAGRIPGEAPDGKKEQVRCAFAANIYSPVEQDVTLGMFWGPHYLNGQEIHPTKTEHQDPAWNTPLPLPPPGHPVWCTNRGNRQDYPVRLQPGWNFLYGEPAVLRGQQGILLGLPRGKGLVASVDTNPDNAHTILFSDGMPVSILHAARSGEIPRTMDAIASMAVVWHRVERGAIAPLPARLIGWDTLANREPPATPHGVENLHIPTGKPWVVLFDLGCERMGHISLDIEAPAGTIFDVAYEERVREDGLVAIYHCNWLIDNADRFIAAGGRQQIEGFRQRACRFVQISIRNSGASGQEVILHRVQYRQTILPIQMQGRFNSSDPIFNWVWSAGVDSIRTCTDSVFNADSWRENAMYANDLVPIYQAASTFLGDPAMMRRCLRLFADCQQPDGAIPHVVPAWWAHADVSWFILLVGYYVQHTGDMELLRELWPTIERALDRPQPVSPRGLIDLGEAGGWFDWGMTPEVMRGENFSPNAHYFGALQSAAVLATLLKKTARAKQCRSRAAQVKRAYQHLWDPSTSRYAATLLDGKPLDVPSPHANALALYYGLTEPDKVAGALAFVEQWVSDDNFLAPGHMELSYHYWALQVLYRHGRVALAEHVMRRNWGIMKVRNSWSIWETLSRVLRGEQQLCQAWGCTPLTMMSQQILGVRPAPLSSARPREVLITPTAATLRFAQGAVPHPAGPIEVDWRIHGQGPGQWLELNIIAPSSLKLRIEPRGVLGDMPVQTSVRRYSRSHSEPA